MISKFWWLNKKENNLIYGDRLVRRQIDMLCQSVKSISSALIINNSAVHYLSGSN
jgi:hypothetical protein